MRTPTYLTRPTPTISPSHRTTFHRIPLPLPQHTHPSLPTTSLPPRFEPPPDPALTLLRPPYETPFTILLPPPHFQISNYPLTVPHTTHPVPNSSLSVHTYHRALQSFAVMRIWAGVAGMWRRGLEELVAGEAGGGERVRVGLQMEMPGDEEMEKEGGEVNEMRMNMEMYMVYAAVVGRYYWDWCGWFLWSERRRGEVDAVRMGAGARASTMVGVAVGAGVGTAAGGVTESDEDADVGSTRGRGRTRQRAGAGTVRRVEIQEMDVIEMVAMEMVVE